MEFVRKDTVIQLEHHTLKPMVHVIVNPDMVERRVVNVA